MRIDMKLSNSKLKSMLKRSTLKRNWLVASHASVLILVILFISPHVTGQSVQLIDMTNATCPESNDGSISVRMNGGQAPYSFVWSNGETSTSGQAKANYTLLGHFEDHSYYRSTVQAPSLVAAQTNAETHFGHLVSINSAAENAWLIANGVQNGDNLGGTDAVSEGNWVWASGEPFSYTNWAPGEPNNGSGSQHSMQMYANGTWDDVAWASGAGARHIIEISAVSEIINLAPGQYNLTVTDAGGTSVSATYNIGPDPIAIGFSMSPTTTCATTGNGALQAQATGGNAPYTYSWDSGETVASISNKASGNYEVTVTDAASCSPQSAVGSITVNDLTAPSVSVKSATIYLGQNGLATVTATDIDNNSTDDCAIADMFVQNADFDCSTSSGSLTATLVVEDAAGNTASADALINLIDTIKPVISLQNVQVMLDGSGQASIAAPALDNGSSDNCAIISSSLSKSTFTCEDLGVNNVTVTIEDASGNTRSAIAQVEVLDEVAPSVSVQDMEVFLDASGQASIAVADVEMSSSDNCGIASKSLNLSTFSCADLGQEVEVILTVTDNSGNDAHATAMVTVSETIDPVAIATDYTVVLDASGVAVLTASQVGQFIGAGSTDNCSLNAASHQLDQMAFSCADLGENTLSYTVADNAGNSADAVVTITVVDESAPLAVAQNLVVELDENGAATIIANDADNGSTDNCAVAARSLDISEFSCENIGINDVNLTVSDGSGNSSVAPFQVEVVDNLAPAIPAELSTTVYLDEDGMGFFDTAPLIAQATDNCGISHIGDVEEEQDLNGFPFSCAEIGTSSGPLYAIDVNGNTTEFMLNLNIVDTIKPLFSATSINVTLSPDGLATLTEEMLMPFASDNCGINEVAIQITDFDCSQVGQSQFTEVIVFDVNGNFNQQTLEVILIDNVIPEVNVQDITISLNADGEVALSTDVLSMFIVDNCSPDNFSLSQSDFSCADMGVNTITLSVSDAGGNTGTAEFEVTVVDDTSPEISGPQVLTICQGSAVNYDVVSASDNCSAILTLIDGPQAGDTPVAGEYMVEFEAVDPSGNPTSHILMLEVAPNAVVDLGEDMEVESGTIVTLVAGGDLENTYLWSDGSTEPELIFTATEDVVISVEVTTPSGCTTDDEITVSIDGTLGTDTDAEGNAASFYPNPTKGALFVKLTLNQMAHDVTVQVVDISGKAVTKELVSVVQNGEIIALDLSGIADGIYLINVVSDNFNLTRRVVKH